MAARQWQGFNWEDPFGLNQQLNEDQRMIRDSAAQYAQGKLAPRVRQAYRDEYTDQKIFREMGELGLLGPTIEGYG
jgi:glutaryl-CoA dehydrogenase